MSSGGTRLQQGLLSRALALLLLSVSGVGCVDLSERQEPAPPWPSAEIVDATHDFGEVIQGKHLEHAFRVANRGSQDLEIKEVEVPERLTLVGFDRLVPPGGEGEIRLALDTTGLTGSGQLSIIVKSNDPDHPEIPLRVEGRVVPQIEVRPQNRVYLLDVLRGRPATAQVTLVNHQDRLLEILEVVPGDPRYFATTLETVKPGIEYRLTLNLDPSMPAGRFEEEIVIRTDSPELPEIPIFARAKIREVLQAQPDEVRFGRMILEGLDRPGLAERRIEVDRVEGGEFSVLEATVDLPFLRVEYEPSQPGRSHLIRVRIEPHLAPKGEFSGILMVRTSDPEYPVIRLPITGSLL